MSLTASYDVRCRCGATISVFCADSINAERHPHMRAAILARALHVFECEACNGTITIDKPLLYIDLSRREMYATYPASQRELEREHGEELIEAWSHSVGDRAGEAARGLFGSDRFHVRLCYGLEELREKIVMHQAGLSDLAVEAVKAEVMASIEELRLLGVLALRLDTIDETGRFVFVAERATDPSTLLELGLVIERERYDKLANLSWQDLLAKFPGIAAGPHVSLMRWALRSTYART